MSFGGALCTRCGQGFAPHEEMVNSNGEIWHTKCFVEGGQAAMMYAGPVEQDNLVLQLDALEVEGSAGMQEHRFPVELEECAESISGEILEPGQHLQWHHSGLQPLEQSPSTTEQSGSQVKQSHVESAVFQAGSQAGFSAEQSGTQVVQIGHSMSFGSQSGQTGWQAGQSGQTVSQSGQTGWLAGQSGQTVSQSGQTGWQAGQSGQTVSQSGQTGLQAGQTGLQTGQTGLQAGQTGWQAGQSVSQAGQTGWQAGQSGLQTGQTSLQAGQSASQNVQATRMSESTETTGSKSTEVKTVYDVKSTQESKMEGERSAQARLDKLLSGRYEDMEFEVRETDILQDEDTTDAGPSTKSNLKRQSSLQEARSRFQDNDDIIRHPRARDMPILEIYEYDDSAEAGYNTQNATGTSSVEVPYEEDTNGDVEENLSKFPVDMNGIRNGDRPPTEYMNAPEGTQGIEGSVKYDGYEKQNYNQDKYYYGQEYDGSTLRAQSGGRQRSVADRYPVSSGQDYPLSHKPAPKFSSEMLCAKCERLLDLDQPIVNYNGNVWHPNCFVCVQCFQPFPDGIFYEFEGRKYCEHDFHMLFAPCCGACGEFVVGRVIKAMNANWHPHCFLCDICNVALADAGFYKNAGRALCKECNNREKAAGMGKYVCHKCHAIIEEGHIKFKGEAFHPYHFNCTNCGVELNPDAREKNGELFCLRCHDKMGIPICGACRRPIEERVVHALGKTWHVEHFVCAKCEKPFLGARHYEKRGLAYCEIHYHQLFGNICFVCNNVIAGDVFSALNKSWCTNHFQCYLCDRKLSQKSKFFDFDLKPVCKTCYEHFPTELKKRMKKSYDQSPKK